MADMTMFSIGHFSSEAIACEAACQMVSESPP
jgi:hypothetical protein